MPMVGIPRTTLGGGFGWPHCRFGLWCENLISARLITADAQATTVNAALHSDLFWALRRGGARPASSPS